jgi:hypothetical protein
VGSVSKVPPCANHMPILRSRLRPSQHNNAMIAMIVAILGHHHPQSKAVAQAYWTGCRFVRCMRKFIRVVSCYAHVFKLFVLFQPVVQPESACHVVSSDVHAPHLNCNNESCIPFGVSITLELSVLLIIYTVVRQSSLREGSPTPTTRLDDAKREYAP